MFQTAWVHHQEDSLYTQFLYGMFFVHLRKQSSRWKSVFDIDDEPMRFETCRRCQKSNQSINLKIVRFVGLCCIRINQCFKNHLCSRNQDPCN